MKKKKQKSKVLKRQLVQKEIEINDLLHRAFGLHKSGQFLEAEQLYKTILSSAPDNPDANHLLGVLLNHKGMVDQGIIYIEKAIENNGKEPAFFSNLGEAYRSVGRQDEAVEAYKKALLLKHDFVEARNNLGNAYRAMGRLDDAFEQYSLALEIRPSFPEALNNLGIVLLDKKKYQGAESFFKKALKARNDYAEAYYNLGIALGEQEKSREAMIAYQEAIRLVPTYASAYNNLGILFFKHGRFDEAFSAFENISQIQPDYEYIQYDFGRLYYIFERYDEAIEAFQHGLTQDCSPETRLMLYFYLSQVYLSKNNITQAEVMLEKALEINSESPEILGMFANVLVSQGRVSESLDYYKKSFACDRNKVTDFIGFLFSLNYNPSLSKVEVFSGHKLWDTWHGVSAPVSKQKVEHIGFLSRRLRVGYLSPDFRNHSVSYFFEPLIKAHDTSRVEIFCYSNVNFPDSVTERLKVESEHWRDIAWMPDSKEVADQIKKDGIDILVDLAGHTAGNRLPVFAYKPAPIQVNWLGYPNTTGMATMDYRLTDDIADPKGESDQWYTEKLVRLHNGFLCYLGDDSHPIAELSVEKESLVTFGSFNMLPKITQEVIELWSEILQKVPHSRIILKNKQLADDGVKNRYLNLFSDFGITGDRIDLLSRLPRKEDHMKLYNKIDIGLDPLFYNGTTTTCEALWMGVPVITLRGDRHASRVGSSILTRIGLEELIAENQQKYVDIAVALAQDKEKRAFLRSSLRKTMKNSDLCDAQGFAREIERNFFLMVEKEKNIS